MTSRSKDPLYIPYAGPALLENPLLNKGCAFSQEERQVFNLTGLLPPRYETIEEQAQRAYQQYSSFRTAINKHIYLRSIQDTNETLFYRLLQDHLPEMMPIIYTPTVGDACEQFSDIYRNNRGLFISYEERHYLDDILRNTTKRNIKIIVVTDGERVLGLGDQGIGGMGISIGKLSLYTACGGISPAYTLPVVLDTGTNNEKLLADPMYMGERHKRIPQQEYDDFIDLFLKAVKRRWPNVIVQFEDFAQPNATPILQRYRDRLCCFNDDIQGTAAVTVGTLLAACRVKNQALSEQRVVFVGAGSAGCGIAEQVVAQMQKEGLAERDARKRIFMVDRFGLVTKDMTGLRDFQQKLAQSPEIIANWHFSCDFPTLLDVIEHAKPSILIGVSGQPGLFSKPVIRAMQKVCNWPMIFPLSNPPRQVEATPEQIVEWTDGRVLLATGSPFPPVEYKGKHFIVTQCNNSYIFPGIGLGIIAVNAQRITDEMLITASETLAAASPLANNGHGELLPPLTALPELSRQIAFAVGKVAQRQHLALEIDDDQLRANIEANFWHPVYRQYKRVCF